MRRSEPAKGGSTFTRREVLGTASLAAISAAVLPVSAVGAAQQPQRYQVGKDPGKHEPLTEFKFDLEATTGWVGEGGSAKEATVEEFPASQSIAAVSMRLKPGAIRELHWHAIAAEWAFMIAGRVRTTVISPTGQASTDDFGPGDIWYFPKGHGHSIQSLGPDDAHFLLAFDNGHFSEFGTFSITDWMARTPPDILSRNLGISAGTIAKLPSKEAYILPGKVPPAAQEPYRGADIETSQSAHKFRMGAMPAAQFPGGVERVVSSLEFPIQTTLTAVLQELQPGALREMHWHPHADEWQYYLAGRSRITIFGAHGRSKTEEFAPGQVAFIQQGFGHYVEQVGSEPTRIIVLFNSPVYQEISLSKWLAGNPASLLADNLGLSEKEVAMLPRETKGILK